MRLAIGVAAAVTLGLAAPAAAQEVGNVVPDPTNEPSAFSGDYLSVGVGVGYGPTYAGSNDYRASPVALVQGAFHGVKINSRAAGLALDFIPDPASGVGFNLGVAARARFDRAGKTHDPVVDSLGELSTAVEVGPTAGITINHLLSGYDSLSFNVDARWDVAGAHKGMVVDPMVSYFTPFSRAVAASLSLSAEYGDDKFEDYYYSVSPMASAVSGLPAFHASHGWSQAGATLMVGYDLDGDLLDGGPVLVVGGGYSRILGDARRSPLVSVRGDPDQWFGAVGIGYTF